MTNNPISDHIRASPFPYMVWVIGNMFFLTFLNIYDVDITFRSIKGSMAVFDFNSTSKTSVKTHKRHATKHWTYVIVTLHQKLRTYCFFIYIRNTFRPFFFTKKNEWMLSFEHLTWTWMQFFADFSWFYTCNTISKVKVRTRSLSLRSTFLTN